MRMRRRFLAALLAAAALPLLSGCMDGTADAGRGATASAAALTDEASPLTVPDGTQMAVRLDSNLSSESAQVGDPWSGTVVTGVTIGSQKVIPSGSAVRGIVTGAQPAARGTRAMLDLAIQEVSIAGAPRPLAAGTPAILADLPAAPATGEVAGATTAMPMGRQAPSEARPVGKGSPVVLESGAELVFVVTVQGSPR